MHDNRTHPLLQQLPLTVSPFISLPSSATLPYTYKPMPSALPPSTSGVGVTSNYPSPEGTTNGNGNSDAATSTSASTSSSIQKPKYIISPSSGHAAHPDDIIASCQALQAHVAKLQSDAGAELKALEERIKKRELAEKRRMAPGWLDSEARLLEPERKGGNSNSGNGGSLLDAQDGEGDEHQGANEGKDGGIAGLTQRFGGQGFGLGQPGHGTPSEMAVPDQGEELDKAFGVVGMGQR
ncbi:hypothetical protein B0T20DRAFT_474659 [Sordaria brevicollis]|uniref:Uncharacterized protein n=1 Tax=Sordaria brevicollis TaxID=83679 RepID=A0AAE0PMU5_SORBR|nr:hypothetical protein B0T20DRAFT_474659 [Sordaria brevicollis]